MLVRVVIPARAATRYTRHPKPPLPSPCLLRRPVRIFPLPLLLSRLPPWAPLASPSACPTRAAWDERSVSVLLLI
jgi:hypothetical protein